MADAKNKGAEAPKNTKDETWIAPRATPSAGKSIVDPKYRDKYKGEKDWLAQYLHDHASTTKEVTKTEIDPKNPEAKITKKVTVAAGVDTEKLIALAKANGLNVENLEKQKDTHGFGGRCRMTVRNMLQTVVKQRHLMVGVDGKKITPPVEFMTKIGAPDKPTHKPDGTKIEVPKAPKPAKEAGAAPAPADAKAKSEKADA